MNRTPLAAIFPTRRSGPTCLSDLALDQLALGELSDDRAAAARAHMVGCASCSEASMRIDEHHQRFAAEVDVPSAAARLSSELHASPTAPRAAWWRRLRPVVPAFAAAAIASIGLLAARPSPPPGTVGWGDQLRAKGAGFILSAHVLENPEDSDARSSLYMGTPLQAGDRVGFRVTGDRAGYLTVVGVDLRSEVSLYYPPGQRPESVPAGRDVALRSAVELDDAQGRELVIALRCAAPVPPADVLRAAQQAVRAAVAQGSPATDVGPLGLPCDEARLTLLKAAPAP